MKTPALPEGIAVGVDFGPNIKVGVSSKLGVDGGNGKTSIGSGGDIRLITKV